MLPWVLGTLACPPSHDVSDAGPTTQQVRLLSDDILARAPKTHRATVRNILVGWDRTYAHQKAMGHGDPRAAERTEEQAVALAGEIYSRARRGEDFIALMKQYSEDPGTSQNGQVYHVEPDGKTEPDFQAISLRLEVGEVGVVRTAYGFHIVQRIE
jgi:hypothetical protein